MTDQLIFNIFDKSLEFNASDLHITVNILPSLRINGNIKYIGEEVITEESFNNFIESILTEKQKLQFKNFNDLDLMYEFQERRYRINLFHSFQGASISARVIPNTIPDYKDISLPMMAQNIENIHNGLVLVTGPTGSGKSTTLATIINQINHNQNKHIVTIEDPIEFVHQSKYSLIRQRQVGKDCDSFAAALKSVLRQDPDIILIGEVRDIETIQFALSAAETGHLVFGTLHTNSVHETVDRIIDIFPSSTQQSIRTMLSSSLKMVIAQKLFLNHDGTGRVAGFEVMTVNPAIQNLIRDNKAFQIPSIMQVNSETCITMKQSVEILTSRKLIDKDYMAQYNKSRTDLS